MFVCPTAYQRIASRSLSKDPDSAVNQQAGPPCDLDRPPAGQASDFCRTLLIARMGCKVDLHRPHCCGRLENGWYLSVCE